MSALQPEVTGVAMRLNRRRLPIAPSSGRRFSGIEGLRAIAAGSIVVYHCWGWSSPSGNRVHIGLADPVYSHLPVGVTLFFTLSGFLLYRPFAAALLRGQPGPSYAAYLRNRALRILPAYWVVLLLTTVVLQTTWIRQSAGSDLRIGSLASHPKLLLGTSLFLQNYQPATVLTGIGPAWSLAVEVVFYLVLPLLVLLAFGLGRRASTRERRRIAAFVPALVMLVIGLFGKTVATWVVPGAGPGGGWMGDWHSVLERSFLAQADLFTFGMVVAVLWVDAEDRVIRAPGWSRQATTAALVAAVVLTPVALDRGWLNHYVYDTLMAIGCALLLALVVLPLEPDQAPSRLLRVMETPPLVMTGLISYSLFLWHEPLLWWLRTHHLMLDGTGGFVVNLLLLGTVSWLLAALTYVCVERPALLRKVDSRSQRMEQLAEPGQRHAAP
jgi:peptidoglycan/LPS O-acetylase OafA/YrhL